jgi:Copper type II ascorbate-dependent monooxygenase, C-terminal domain
MRNLVLASVVFLAAFACGTTTDNAGGSSSGASGSSGSSGGDVDGGPGGIGLDGQPPPEGSYNVQFGPQDAPAGEEHTKCVVKRLGNPTPMHVGTVHNVLSDGSHHLVVYRVNDTTEQLTPFDCKPFTDTLDPTKGSTLMISQRKDDALILPEGVAYTLAANQMLRLEMHYINPSGATIPVKATSTFIPIDNAKFKDEADFLFVGTPDIKLSAGQSKDIGPTFIKLPPEYATVNFFAITGHTHQYGTNVVVKSAATKADPGTSVYDVPGWIWSEPATVQATPTFKLPANGGFNFTCSYKNTSGGEVGFGESANAEMCFFWAYYYPSQGGAKVCMHTEQFPGGADACCPGTSPVCDYVKGGL